MYFWRDGQKENRQKETVQKVLHLGQKVLCKKFYCMQNNATTKNI